MLFDSVSFQRNDRTNAVRQIEDDCGQFNGLLVSACQVLGDRLGAFADSVIGQFTCVQKKTMLVSHKHIFTAQHTDGLIK